MFCSCNVASSSVAIKEFFALKWHNANNNNSITSAALPSVTRSRSAKWFFSHQVTIIVPMANCTLLLASDAIWRSRRTKCLELSDCFDSIMTLYCSVARNRIIGSGCSIATLGDSSKSNCPVIWPALPFAASLMSKLSPSSRSFPIWTISHNKCFMVAYWYCRSILCALDLRVVFLFWRNIEYATPRSVWTESHLYKVNKSVRQSVKVSPFVSPRFSPLIGSLGVSFDSATRRTNAVIDDIKFKRTSRHNRCRKLAFSNNDTINCMATAVFVGVLVYSFSRRGSAVLSSLDSWWTNVAMMAQIKDAVINITLLFSWRDDNDDDSRSLIILGKTTSTFFCSINAL